MWKRIKRSLGSVRDFFWPSVKFKKTPVTNVFNQLLKPGLVVDFKNAQDQMVRFSTKHTQDDFYEKYLPMLNEKEEANIVDDINLKAELEKWPSPKEGIFERINEAQLEEFERLREQGPNIRMKENDGKTL